MPLTPHKWGLFYPDNCPWFSQAPGICTSMVAGSCMNNISVKWLGSYLFQWLNFTLQLLRGDFIWYLNSTGSGRECTKIPERRQCRAKMNLHAVKPAQVRVCRQTAAYEQLPAMLRMTANLCVRGKWLSGQRCGARGIAGSEFHSDSAASGWLAGEDWFKGQETRLWASFPLLCERMN